VIDTATNTVTDTVTVGDTPRGMGITPDGAYVYVTNEWDDNVSVIDTSTNTVVGAPIGVGTFPGAIALALVPAPVNLDDPFITGQPLAGQTLSCHPGTWSGAAQFTFQWRRDREAITGETEPEYQLTNADVGHSIDCLVTATNSIGSTSEPSNSTLVANPAGGPPGPPGPPGGDANDELSCAG